MPLVTTALLDDFQRADEFPLYGGGNWGPVASNGLWTLELDLHAGRVSGTFQFGASFFSDRWLPLTVTGDSQVWGVEYQKPDNGFSLDLGLLTGTGTVESAISGYLASFAVINSSTSQTVLRRIDAGALTIIDFVNTGDIHAQGNVFLLRIDGTEVETYYSTDGGDTGTLLASATDNTYRADLKLALATGELFEPTAEWDAFGGGPVLAATTNQLAYLGVGP